MPCNYNGVYDERTDVDNIELLSVFSLFLDIVGDLFARFVRKYTNSRKLRLRATRVFNF